MDQERPGAQGSRRLHRLISRRGVLCWGGLAAIDLADPSILHRSFASFLHFISRDPGLRARGQASTDTPSKGRIALAKSLPITHGNAAHVAWSGDGRTLYLANEEGYASSLKLDVSDPAHIKIAAMRGFINFCWAVESRHGIILYRESVGGGIVRIDPAAWTQMWSWAGGRGHAVISDGTKVFVPIEGNPGALAVLDASTGAERRRVSVGRHWPQVYAMGLNEAGHVLVVAAQTNGTSVFDISGATPTQVSQISEPAWQLALVGTKLCTFTGSEIVLWDLSRPSAPVKTGAWPIPVNSRWGRPPDINDVAFPPDGRRLFATFMSRQNNGNPDMGSPAGVYMLDTTGPAPMLRQTLDQRVSYPVAVAVSPDNRTLALTQWAWGVFLYDVSQDRFTPYSADGSGFATTGEARDAYTDGKYVYVWAHDNIQIFDLDSGVRTAAIPGGDGGWRPFRDGHVIMRGSPALDILHLEHGTVREITRLTDLTRRGSNWVNDLSFDDPYVYAAGEGGYLHTGKVGPWNGAGYSFTPLADLRVSGNPSPRNIPIALCKNGTLVWVTGPAFGVVAADVTDPAHPKIVYRDEFTFKMNNFTSMASARGRMYAGCGDQGVRIYDAASLRHSGSIGGSATGVNGLSANFVDVYKGTWLIVANYWYPQLPEGMYVYDVSTTPDAPRLVQSFPLGPNFRVRAFDSLGLIIRIGLGTVDVFRA